LVALIQTQSVAAVADRSQLSRSDAERALFALDEVVLEELGHAQAKANAKAALPSVQKARRRLAA
jgi:hypothetical protein